VCLGVRFRGFVAVMLGVSGMAMRDLCVMGGLFDRSRFMMLGGFAMMFRGLFVMLGGLSVMFCDLGCGGGHSLILPIAPKFKAFEDYIEGI
jgi:hypothetical protein